MQQVFSDTRFSQLDIPIEILEGIDQAGYEFCTPVQNEVLPRALKGEDIAAQSQTGTGKTATFLITLLAHLVKNRPEKQTSQTGSDTAKPRALILAPTRELVVQIEKEASALSRPAGINFQAIYGGVDYEKQRSALLRQKTDVVVATPGRLIDYMKQKVLSLKEIEVLIIDEADRMFDMGFIPDVRWLLHRSSPAEKRQSLLFSATLSEKVMELAYEHLNIREAVNINPEQLTVDKIKQSLYHVGKDEKMALLFGLLKQEKPERSLIFTNTKRMAEILENYLQANDYAAACLTGDVPQKKRLATLESFKKQKLSILIATDVASRGLHIDAVTHVFNYDLPQDAEDYIHRIGRTARIGATGNAIALAGEEDAFYLEAIEKLSGKIPVIWAEEEDFIRKFRRPSRRSYESSNRRGPASSNGRRGDSFKERDNRSGSSRRAKPTRYGDKPKNNAENRQNRSRSHKPISDSDKQPLSESAATAINDNSNNQPKSDQNLKSSKAPSRRRPPRKYDRSKKTEYKSDNKKTSQPLSTPVKKAPVNTPATPAPPIKSKKKNLFQKISAIFKK
ncbi:DEAD/DEAH box helicase [bacterium]|nr:DEAD/DEAH box helicase [bacterium]